VKINYSNRKINLILFSVMIFSIFSCTSREDKIADTYWVKVKKTKPKELVKFTADGRYIEYNNLDIKVKYSFKTGKMILDYPKGDSREYYIKTFSDSVILLSGLHPVGDGKIINLKRATEKNFFLGKWIKSDEEKRFEYDFKGDGKGDIETTIEGYIAKKPLSYKVEDGSITINNEKKLYKFNEDKTKIELFNGKSIFLERVME